MTKFLLIKQTDDKEGWHPWTTVEASNDETAIRNAYMANPDGKITSVVAVPYRSWKPKQIRTEKIERLRLTDTPPKAIGKPLETGTDPGPPEAAA